MSSAIMKMISRTLQKTKYKSSSIRIASTLPPPTFLLPLQACLATASTSSTTTTTRSTDPNPPPNAYTSHNPPPPPSSTISPAQHTTSASPPYFPPRNPQLSRHTPFTHLPSPTTSEPDKDLLLALAAQRPHYITAHIHARPYLLTEGDTLRLPFRMPHATPGTVLRLNRASVLGSRDFTFRGSGTSGGGGKRGGIRADGRIEGVSPWIDEKYFVCRAIVVGVEGEPMRIILKTKRRQRKVQRVTSKGRFTILRIVKLEVRPYGDAGGEGALEEEEAEDLEDVNLERLTL